MAEKEQSKTEYIRDRLLEAESEEELEEICTQLKAEPGVAAGSVDAEKSKLKKKGSLQFKSETTKSVQLAKPLPIEALISELSLPPMVNGSRQVFDSGVSYGMRSILIGVRVAQELSKMGIDQASPIIRMAQELRQSETQIARDTGLSMGEAIAGKLLDYFETRLPQKADVAGVPKPMEGMFARAMETMLSGLMSRFMGPAGAQQQGGLPTGWTDQRKQGG